MPSFVPFQFRFYGYRPFWPSGLQLLETALDKLSPLKAKNHTLKFPSRRTVLLAD